MGRLTKQGIDYFSLDVEFDAKTDLYIMEHEADGLAVLITLLQLIYKDHGYWIIDSEDTRLLIKRKINVGINDIDSCINTLINRNVFNKKLYEKYKVITSTGIQKRYFDAAKKKKEVKIVNEFLLISIDSYENAIDVGINAIDSSGYATKEKEEVKEKEKEKEDSAKIDSSVKTWNFFADNYKLSKVVKITDVRKRNIKQRLLDKDFDLEQILREAEKQPFLLGANKQGWSIDFDFIFGSKNNYVKIMEGKYYDRKKDNGASVQELANITQNHFSK